MNGTDRHGGEACVCVCVCVCAAASDNGIMSGDNGSSVGGSMTLDLLAQYNNHRFERDKELEYIERRAVSEDRRPSYDELFKENVNLKLQLEEKQNEILRLQQVISSLDHDDVVMINQVDSQNVHPSKLEKTNVPLPPRSSDRKSSNLKKLSLRDATSVKSTPDSYTETNITPKSVQLQTNSGTIKSLEKEPLTNLHTVQLLDDSAAASPATSVTYKTSRIAITSPSKKLSPEQYTDANKFMDERVRSPQNSNRIAAVINNQIHSPLKENHGIIQEDVTEQPPLTKSPLIHLQPQEELTYNLDFSPSSKEKLNSFAHLLDTSFGEEDMLPLEATSSPKQQVRKPPPLKPLFTPSPSNAPKLGSPVMVNKTSTLPEASVSNKPSISGLSIHSTNPLHPNLSNSTGQPLLSRTESDNTVKSNQTKISSDIPLFVKPEDFNTIRMEVLSTLYSKDCNSVSSDDSLSILFAVIDRQTNKTIFKYSKNVNKVYELHNYIQNNSENLGLPALPEKQLFQTTVPAKVDLRRNKIKTYMDTLFSIPVLSPHIGLKIAQFISTDTLMHPLQVGDCEMEGYLLMRRSKALGSASSWRIRYGILRNETLQLFENLQRLQQYAEIIKLRQSSIELLPNLPEDRYGTKNGFVINEHRKSGLSSTTKYYLCTEASKEREEWISMISNYLENSSYISKNTPNPTSNDSAVPSFFGSKIEGGEQHYVTDLTVDSSHNSSLTESKSPKLGGDSSFSNDTSIDYSNDIDKDSKRSKMRSLFPFKKTLPSSSTFGETSSNQDDDLTNAPSMTLSKSLEMMNLLSGPTNENKSAKDKVFGSSLEDCLKLSSNMYNGKYEIPSIVYRCLEFLYKNRGIQEEGIFRLSGSTTLIKSLQEEFDKNYDVDLYQESKSESIDPSAYIDVNTVSGLLKLYLRKLPHLLFGDDQYLKFKKIVDDNRGSPQNVAIEFGQLIQDGTVPAANVSLMYALFELLVRINENSRINKMNLRNLCIVFSPTLNIPINILQPFIVDFACVFKGEPPIDNNERESVDVHIPQV